VHCAGRFFSSAYFFLVEVFIQAGKAAIGKNGNLAAQAAQIPLRERPRHIKKLLYYQDQ